MSIYMLVLTAIALAMDAFAVSVSCALSGCCQKKKDKLSISISFGFFQMLMPIIGYFLASMFSKYIMSYDHWIAFILLVFIGGKMLVEAFGDDEDESFFSCLSLGKLILFSIATSIDAMAAGISFAFLEINILVAGSLIGIITFAISYIGCAFGKLLGEKLQKNAEITGGVILILIGFKILFEHIGIL